MLSPSEQAFLLRGVASNLRQDGRGRMDFRHFTLETGLISQANGSSRLRLDNTDVLVGVKVELGHPLDETPDEGRVLFSVECSPSASPKYEGRGAEEINTELAAVVARLMCPRDALDVKSLCLVPKHQCWVVYVDAVVLNSGGNLIDAICIATRAALQDAKIPRVEVVASSTPGVMDIEVSEDANDYLRLDISRVPVSVTLSKLGLHYIADATLEEESCRTSSLTVSVAEDGAVLGTHKGGPGGLDPPTLFNMVQEAQKVSKAMHAAMDDAIKSCENLPRVGFFA